MPEVATAALVTAASELAHNQLRHGAGGGVAVRRIERGDQVGLEVVAADEGPGIADVARALEGRRTDPRSLGAGLSAVLELSDEVDFDVRLAEGTCIRARKFPSLKVRHRRVGVYGRPCQGEQSSGDDAVLVRSAGSLLVGVVDGLGHGPLAREASFRARTTALDRPELATAALLGQVDAELRGTRGAVMSVARVPQVEGDLEVSCVGNVGLHVYGMGGSRRFGGSSFVLGAPGPSRVVRTETAPFGRHDVLVVFSDGITSRLDLRDERELLREHPIVIAQRVVERFGRGHDDVLALVVA
jgi:hypothetical protein